MMKNLLFLFVLSSIWECKVFAQTTQEAHVDSSLSPVTIADGQQDETGVVIIDDDELGIVISPNPSTNYITITSKHNLSTYTFVLSDNIGNTVLIQLLSNNTIDVSHLNNGLYHWVISDIPSHIVCSGSLVVLH